MQADRYEELFRASVIATIEGLKLATGQPRESILRDMKSIGYYSSYNARGRFYTLSSIPDFDDFGLWKYQDAFFSIRRTLIDTVEHLVTSSTAGYTHDELRRILGIGMQNTLRQLTMADKVTRRLIGDRYVYFDIETANGQMEMRSAIIADLTAQTEIKARNVEGYPDMDAALVIDILVAVLRGNGTESAAYSYLHKTGSLVTEQQVKKTFSHYGIGKKNS